MPEMAVDFAPGSSMADKMKRYRRMKAGGVFLVAGMALLHAARADVEVTGPDGRRVLLKDDGTWRYLDAKDKASAKDKEPAKERPKLAGEAVLRLERKTEVGTDSCRFGLQLTNNFPYVITSFVPTFSAHRANEVVYDSQTAGFFALKPGDSQSRDILFRGIACKDIARLQVVGGDRCVMGELDRFTLVEEGACLSRVRVVASELVHFDKEVTEDKDAKGDKDVKGTKDAKGDKDVKGSKDAKVDKDAKGSKEVKGSK